MNTRRLFSVGSLILAFAGLAAADEVILIPNATFKVPGGRVRGNVEAETPNVVKIQPAAGAVARDPRRPDRIRQLQRPARR